MEKMKFSFAVLGASGNVGSKVVHQLSTNNRVNKIVLLNRRKVPELEGFEKVQSLIVDMDNIGSSIANCEELNDIDGLIITMGVGASSKSTKEELIKVDIIVPTNCAEALRKKGVKHVSLMTATGADSTCTESMLTGTAAGGGLYRQCKGIVEENIQAQGYDSVAIFRPAGIIGSSHSPDMLLKCFTFDFMGKFKSIEIDDLARAIVKGSIDALDQKNGVVIYEGQNLFDAGSKVDDIIS